MAHANLPNLNSVTDQLRVDNNVVGHQSETFIVVAGPSAKPPVASDSASKTESSEPDDHPAPTDAFPWMRAYGCLGRKTGEEK